jgi:RNA polymerase sigma-70 factor (ECF subfamily)
VERTAVSPLGRRFDATAPALYSLALRITGAAAEAEDVVEQTLLEAWRMRPESAPAPRFATLARRCRDLALVRSGKRSVTSVRRRPPPALRGGTPSGAATPDLDATREAAAATMARLSEADRHALEMAYFEGYRVTDVAACARCTPEDVVARLRRAIAAFTGPGSASERIALCAPPAEPSPALRARLLDAVSSDA